MPYLTSANDIKNIITQLSQATTLWLDTEVAEYQSKNPRLSLIQVLANSPELNKNPAELESYTSRTYVLDILDKPELVEDFINQIMVNPHIEKVLHNVGYDIRFLGNDLAQNATCTLKMAKQIPYYVLPLPNFQLKTLIQELCQVPYLDKEEQGSDWGRRPLTEKQLEYATKDAAYLAQVHSKLLEIINKINPDPATDNLIALGENYQKLEADWKPLDTEITQIKERIKTAMQVQKIAESSHFRLSKSTIMKVDFLTLAILTQTQGIELNFPVTLTKELQKQLGNLIQHPSLEIEEIPTWRLTTKVQRRKSTKENHPDPATENISELSERYREILPEWKLLDSEINHLKERTKKAMLVQSLKETPHFKLASSSTFKVKFDQLSKLMQSVRIELDFPVTLTKDIQQRLGRAIDEIDVQIEYNTSWRLNAKTVDNEDEDIPF